MYPLSHSEEPPGILHDLCDSFEELWQDKGDVKLALFWEQIQPTLEDWPDQQRKHLARELVKLDLEFRWRRFSLDNNTVDLKEKATVFLPERNETSPRLLEDYLDLGIGLVGLDDMTVDLVLEEYRVRHLWGDRPDHQEYQERFREKMDALANRLSAVDSDLDAERLRGSNDAHVSRHSEHQGLAGKTFGDYELLEEVARGGMGVIYRARQISLDRIVAIKMILSGQLANQDDIVRFRTEAQSAAKLTHPNIVRIYEIDQLDGQHFFSMRYVDGESLSQRLKNGSLGNFESAQLIKTIAEAIRYAHQQDILHRDLKPQNILLDERGQPWITDFGLSKKMSVDSDLTATGQILGTPSYMPPEQANGITGNCEPASDIYSLGAILYELVTGRPPFQAPTAFDTLVMVMEKEPISPRQLNPGIDVDIETIILKCLQKNIGRRYSTAQQLIEELERYLAGEPILARPVGKLERSWRWCQRNPLVASLVATIGIILVLSTFVSLRYAVIAQEEAQAAKLAESHADTQRIRAEEARAAEQKQRMKADEAARRSDEAAKKEETQRLIAETNERNAKKKSYLSDMRLAKFYWDAGDIPNMAETLGNQENEPEMGNFEFHYLKRLVNNGKLYGENPVQRLKTSSGGKYLVTRNFPNLTVYNAADFSVIKTIRVNATIPSNQSFAINRDETLLVALESESQPGKQSVTVYQLPECKIVHSIPTGRFFYNVCFSATSKEVFLQDGLESISKYTLGEDKLQDIFTNSTMQKGFYQSGVFPMGSHPEIFFATWNTLNWITQQDNKVLKKLPPGKSCRALATNRAGTLVAIKTQNGVLEIMTFPQLESVSTINAGLIIDLAAFVPGEKKIATLDRSGTLCFWDIQNGKKLLTLRGKFQGPFDFLPGGKVVLPALIDSADQKRMRVLNWKANQKFEHQTVQRQFFAISGDFKTFVVDGFNNELSIWKSATQKFTCQLVGHNDRVTQARFHPDSTKVISSSTDKTARIWDITSGTELHTLSGHDSPISSVNFSPQGNLAVTQDRSHIIKLWDVKSGKLLKTLHSNRNADFSDKIFFSPSQQKLISNLGIWDIGTGKLVYPMNQRCFAVSPNGNVLVHGTMTGRGGFHITDTETGKILKTITSAHQIRDVVFNNQGDRFFICDNRNNQISVWNTETADLLLQLNTDQISISKLNFCKKQEILCSSGGADHLFWNGTPSKRQTPKSMANQAPSAISPKK